MTTIVESPPKLRHWLLVTIKTVIALAVVGGVFYTIMRAFDDIQRQGFSLSRVDLRWLFVASLLYLLGLVPSWLFWHQTLCSLRQSPTLWESFRAFYIGHLGKYVPGKAMVVVLRTGLVRSDRTDSTVAAVSVFVETLMMMASGAFLSAAILLVRFRDNVGLIGLAVGLMLVAGLPIIPPVFRRLVSLLQVHRAHPEIHELLKGLDWRLMLTGWMQTLLGWTILGTSLFAVLMAISPQTHPSQLLVLIACTSLAVVAGFLSMLPGGIGVRELVIVPLLVAGLGFPLVVACVSAVLLRLCWLLSEAVLSIILYVAPRFSSRTTATTT